MCKTPGVGPAFFYIHGALPRLRGRRGVATHWRIACFCLYRTYVEAARRFGSCTRGHGNAGSTDSPDIIDPLRLQRATPLFCRKCFFKIFEKILDLVTFFLQKPSPSGFLVGSNGFASCSARSCIAAPEPVLYSIPKADRYSGQIEFWGR